MIRKLLKQSSIYFVGLSIGKVLSTVTFILLARHLLSEGFGTFTLYITLLQVITFFGDFGLNQWYQKHVEDHGKKQMLHNILFFRIFTLVISAFIASIMYLYSALPQQLLWLFLVTLIPEAFLSVVDGFYLEQRKSVRVSLKTISKTSILLGAFIALQGNFSVETAMYTYSISCFITCAWFFPWNHLTSIKTASIEEFKTMAHQASSYAFLIFTSFAYSRGDSLIISYTLNNSALGLYGAAYRYLDSLSLIPTALAHNLFPISAKKEGLSFEQLKKITYVMLGIGSIIALIVYFSAELLTVGLLGEDYRAALPLVQVFAGVILLFFLNSALSTVVQSSRYIKQFLPFGFVNTAANITLNLMCVPLFGLQAAAWVMLFTEITGMLINVYFVKKIYN